MAPPLTDAKFPVNSVPPRMVKLPRKESTPPDARRKGCKHAGSYTLGYSLCTKKTRSVLGAKMYPQTHDCARSRVRSLYVLRLGQMLYIILLACTENSTPGTEPCFAGTAYKQMYTYNVHVPATSYILHVLYSRS